jgi:hypothetical protein
MELEFCELRLLGILRSSPRIHWEFIALLYRGGLVEETVREEVPPTTEGGIDIAIPNRYRVTVLMLAMVLAAGLLVAVLAKPAWAEDSECVGVLTGVHDNVVVPPEAFCSIEGAQVNGNVKALHDSRLFMFGTTVFGSVEGDKAEVVTIRNNSVVRQNILIKNGETPDNDDAVVCATTVQEGNIHVEKMTGEIIIGGFSGTDCSPNTVEKGSIKVEKNISAPLINGFGMNIVGNQVAQNLQVFKNKGLGSTKFVLGNTVGQNLQCFENDERFIGGPNAAQKAEGQCF